jgi:hypothetical protein
MSLLSEDQPVDLADLLRDTYTVTADFISDIILQACRRCAAKGPAGKTGRVQQLIKSGAWTDAALALIDLELPQWQVRRLVYDNGEWHAALSHQRELPDWLDEAVEGHHADLVLAILSAFLEARRQDAPSTRPNVPAAPLRVSSLYEPVLVDNFA